MTTPLDRLLKSIHPRKTLDETVQRANEALNEFRCNRSVITEWKDFPPLMASFVICVMRHVLRLPREWVPDGDGSFEWSMCCRVLRKLYGESGGVQAAFEMVRTANEGGIHRVLRDVMQQMAADFADNEISAKVWAYWNALTLDEQFAAADEYLEKYGDLLPSELTEGNAARIVANMPKVLQLHPRLMQSLGRVGRH
jgi:hypothetical protein